MEGGVPLCLAFHRAVMGTLQRLLKAASQRLTEGLGSDTPDRSCVNALQPSLLLTHTLGKIKDDKWIRECLNKQKK